MIRQDRAPEALALADDVEAAVGRGGGALSLGNTLWLELSAVAAYVGEHERALEFIERFLHVSGGLLSKRIEGLAAKAYVLVRLGRPDAAVAAAEEMVELADELGAAELPSVARHDLGFVLCEVGEHARGVDLLDAVLAEDAKLNAAGARLRRAESLVALGRLRRRPAELRATVLTPLRPADQPETLVPRLARVQALLARARGDDEQARATSTKRRPDGAGSAGSIGAMRTCPTWSTSGGRRSPGSPSRHASSSACSPSERS